jgi:antitoxin ParD1/3/4
MNISLTHDLEQFATDKLKSGRYTSASEVIRDGLRMLVERDQLYQIRLEELRKEIQKGIDSGEATPFDPEAIMAKVSARMGHTAPQG